MARLNLGQFAGHKEIQLARRISAVLEQTTVNSPEHLSAISLQFGHLEKLGKAAFLPMIAILNSLSRAIPCEPLRATPPTRDYPENLDNAPPSSTAHAVSQGAQTH